jgi:hypothetical protein
MSSTVKYVYVENLTISGDDDWLRLEMRDQAEKLVSAVQMNLVAACNLRDVLVTCLDGLYLDLPLSGGI